MLEGIRNWYQTNVHGALWQANEQLATGIDSATQGAIKTDTVRKALPLVAGAATVAGGVFAFPLVEKAAKAVFTGASKLVTGFGLFEKIPLAGQLFTKLGAGVNAMGNYAAYPVIALGGLLGFSLMSGRTAAPAPVGSQTGLHLTGRTADGPVMTTVTVPRPGTDEPIVTVQAPLKPAEAPPIPAPAAATLAQTEFSAPPEATRINAAVDARRIAQIQGKTKLDAALQEYIGFINQRYENTRAWIDEAEIFRNGPRKKLVAALHEAGLPTAEAESFVPEPPKLQKTVYADGTDFPPALLDFMEKFTALYGETGPQGDTARLPGGEYIFRFMDKQGETPKQKKFSECSVTQKEEFIAKAIEYYRLRKKFFEEDHTSSLNIYWADIPLPFMKCGELRHPNFCDDSKPWKNWYTPTEGDNNGIPWSQEYEKLKEIGGVGGVTFTVLPGMTPIDEQAPAHAKFNTLLENYKKQRADAQAHKAALETANQTVIKEWSASVERMKTRLEGMGTTGIALLRSGVYDTKEQFVILRDLIAEPKGEPMALAFQKQGERFVLTGWRIEKPGTTWNLTPEGNRSVTSLEDIAQLRRVYDDIRKGEPARKPAPVQTSALRLDTGFDGVSITPPAFMVAQGAPPRQYDHA